MRDLKSSSRTIVAALVGLLSGALIVSGLVATAQPVDQTGVGREESCTLDSASGCTINHGFGVKPASITAVNRGPALVSINPALTTATSYRVSFVSHNGQGWPAGTFTRLYVHYDFDAAEPTPTPTPTTPTPTPTATDSPVKLCTNGDAYQEQGQGGYGAYYFYLNDWNDSFAGNNYTAMVCSFDNWWTEADVPNHSDMSVQAYPAMQWNQNNIALSRVQSLRFAHNTTKVPGMTWNVALDMWINSGLSCELMIWTENHNQRPAGNQVASVTIGGQAYTVWKSGSGQCGVMTYLSVNTQTHGTLPLQEFFADLQARGWIPANSTTWQVNYGVEVVDTNDVPHRWNFTDHAVIAN